MLVTKFSVLISFLAVVQKGGVSAQNVLTGRSVYMRIRVLGDGDGGNIALVKLSQGVKGMTRSLVNG